MNERVPRLRLTWVDRLTLLAITILGALIVGSAIVWWHWLLVSLAAFGALQVLAVIFVTVFLRDRAG